MYNISKAENAILRARAEKYGDKPKKKKKEDKIEKTISDIEHYTQTMNELRKWSVDGSDDEPTLDTKESDVTVPSKERDIDENMNEDLYHIGRPKPAGFGANTDEGTERAREQYKQTNFDSNRVADPRSMRHNGVAASKLQERATAPIAQPLAPKAQAASKLYQQATSPISQPAKTGEAASKLLGRATTPGITPTQTAPRTTGFQGKMQDQFKYTPQKQLSPNTLVRNPQKRNLWQKGAKAIQDIKGVGKKVKNYTAPYKTHVPYSQTQKALDELGAAILDKSISDMDYCVEVIEIMKIMAAGPKPRGADPWSRKTRRQHTVEPEVSSDAKGIRGAPWGDKEAPGTMIPHPDSDEAWDRDAKRKYEKHRVEPYHPVKNPGKNIIGNKSSQERIEGKTKY